MVVAEEKLKLCYIWVHTAVFILFFLPSCGNGKLIMSVPNEKDPCNDLGSLCMNLGTHFTLQTYSKVAIMKTTVS